MMLSSCVWYGRSNRAPRPPLAKWDGPIYLVGRPSSALLVQDRGSTQPETRSSHRRWKCWTVAKPRFKCSLLGLLESLASALHRVVRRRSSGLPRRRWRTWDLAKDGLLSSLHRGDVLHHLLMLSGKLLHNFPSLMAQCARQSCAWGRCSEPRVNQRYDNRGRAATRHHERFGYTLSGELVSSSGAQLPSAERSGMALRSHNIRRGR